MHETMMDRLSIPVMTVPSVPGAAAVVRIPVGVGKGVIDARRAS